MMQSRASRPWRQLIRMSVQSQDTGQDEVYLPAWLDLWDIEEPRELSFSQYQGLFLLLENYRGIHLRRSFSLLMSCLSGHGALGLCPQRCAGYDNMHLQLNVLPFIVDAEPCMFMSVFPKHDNMMGTPAIKQQ